MNLADYSFLIPVLAFVAVMGTGLAFVMIREDRKRANQMKLFEERIVQEITDIEQAQKTTFLQFIEKIGNYVSHGQSTTTLAEQLIRAGYLGKSASAVYSGIKMLLFVIGLTAAALIVMPTPLPATSKTMLIFLGGAVLFFIPNLVLVVRFRNRRDEISRYLPEAIDLLEICVSSGIGMDMAWNIVADEIRSVSPILADAMTMSNFEIHLGASRVEAMRHMAMRTGVDEVSSLAAILVQTERFGTSIGATLQVFAASMREERSFTAEENAEKMAVKLIIPMVLFIFPAVLITVVGPAAISIATVMMAK